MKLRACMAFPGMCWMMVFVLAFASCNKNTASSGQGGSCAFKLPLYSASDTGKAEYFVMATGKNSYLEKVVYTNIDHNDTIMNPKTPWDWRSSVSTSTSYYIFNGTGYVDNAGLMIAFMTVWDHNGIILNNTFDPCR
jgi:hypothetical protein